jgi:hypothetical protein
LVSNSGIETMHWCGGSTEIRITLFPHISSQSRVIFSGCMRYTSDFGVCVKVWVSFSNLLDVWLYCNFCDSCFLCHFCHASNIWHASASSLWPINISIIGLLNTIAISVLNGSHWHAFVITHAIHVGMRIKLFFLVIFVKEHFYLFVFTKLLDRLTSVGSMLFLNNVFDFHTI